LKENSSRIPVADKEAIEKAIQDLKGVLEGDDSAKIKEKTEVLMQASMKMGEAMYKQQGDTPAGASDAGSEQPNADEKKEDDTVVDADFEEVKK